MFEVVNCWNTKTEEQKKFNTSADTCAYHIWSSLQHVRDPNIMQIHYELCIDCATIAYWNISSMEHFDILWFERRATGQSHGASSRNVLQESSRKTLPGKLQEPTVQWSCQRWIAYDSIKKWRDPNINSISQLQCDKKIPSLWSHPSSAFISSSL